MKFSDIPKSKGGGADFLTLSSGNNKLRIVSEAVERPRFWSQEYKNNFDYVPALDDAFLAAYNANHEAPIRVKNNYVVYVIDRADGEIKILEIGKTITDQLRELSVSEDYKFDDVPPYDMTIKKEGEKMSTKYTVMAARDNTELTDEEKEKVAGLSPLEDLVAKFVDKRESLIEPSTADTEEVPFE